MIIFLYYLLFINIFSFTLMFIDKRNSIKKRWRISEKTLLTSSIIGGSIGSLAGMKLFRHKTKHFKFKYGLPLMLIIHCIFFFLFIIKNG